MVSVAFLRAFRLPAMLAYFLVGLLLGPHALGILPDNGASHELAEFGVVFLMFSIGLEFSLPQLYTMRRQLVELGGAQVLITIGGAMLIAKLSGMDWSSAFVVGAALAMSSTAIVSKLLTERLDLNSRHGRLSVGILLFQDLAVVPILVLIPALGQMQTDWAHILSLAGLKAIIVLLLLLIFGQKIISPWFNVVASKRSRELFVMNVLMVTLLLATVTKLAGLSYALGAFIAGVLISETHYRYQVESDISPFRDILLGLFFIGIGMLLDIHQVWHDFAWISIICVGFILYKGVIVAGLVRLLGYETGVAIRTALILSQAGEFSFVILSLGLEHHLLTGVYLQRVLAASVLSMMVAPFLIQYNGRIVRQWVKSYTRNSGQVVQDIDSMGKDLHNHVVLCGYGRSGQYLGRFLREEKIPFIALDIDSNRVIEAASAGESVMFGDCGRRVVLEAAGAARAKALIITYSDRQGAMRILHIAQERYPHLAVIVRTKDDSGMEELRLAGATEVVPEVLEGSLMLASHALILLGVPLHRVIRRIRLFREARYTLFRGYFRGISDADMDDVVHKHIILHSIILSPGSFAIGRCLRDITLDPFDVEIKVLRRPGSPHIQLTPESILCEGDVIVVLGSPVGIDYAQNALLIGQMAT